MDRLLAAGNVNDAEAAHAQPDSSVDVDPFIVGPAVDDRSAHFVDLSGIHSRVAITRYNACNTAHIFSRFVVNASIEALLLWWFLRKSAAIGRCSYRLAVRQFVFS
jgi:hypothetical protein